ncbi:MAG: hypothetical protein IPL65_15410 [Lewinellaceae bacterium]|nr:hypothetical protein [Lewinellaceae bacterium]
MGYYVKRFRDKTLSEQEHKEVGLKIRAIQKERYFQSKREIIGDTLLPNLKDQITDGFRQIDAATEQLIAIVSNVEVNSAARWEALRTLAQINTFPADSFLVANIDRIHQLGEYSGGSSGEIEWMYPCFGLLSSKSTFNYTLIKPILSNLPPPKTESELYFINILLLGIFGKEESLRLWENYMLDNAENFVTATKGRGGH